MRKLSKLKLNDCHKLSDSEMKNVIGGNILGPTHDLPGGGGGIPPAGCDPSQGPCPTAPPGGNPGPAATECSTLGEVCWRQTGLWGKCDDLGSGDLICR